MDQKLSIGRIVHYHLTDGQVRPALVVRSWSDTCANLVVFLDGSNDVGATPFPQAKDVKANPYEGKQHMEAPLMMWATSVPQGDGSGQWSWPPRE